MKERLDKKIKKWYTNKIEGRLHNLLGKRFHITQQITLALICVGIIVYFMPRNVAFKYEIKQGYPWEYGRIEASFDFPIKKSVTQMEQESDSVRKNFAHCFRRETIVSDSVFKSTFAKFVGSQAILTSDDSVRSLLLQQEQKFSNVIHKIYSENIILPHDFADISANADSLRLVANDNKIVTKSIKECKTIPEIGKIIARRLEIPEKELLAHIQPNIVYDYEYSQDMLKKELESLPTSNGIVRRGQNLISRGELVDAMNYQILTSYKNEIDQMIADKNTSDGYMLLGQILFITLCFGLLLAYIYIYASEVAKNNSCFTLVMLSVTVFPVIVSNMVQIQMGHVALVPFAMSPMLLSLFATKRTAFLAHTICIIICSIMLNQPYEFIVLQIPAGLVAMLCMKELSSRSQMFTCALLVLLTYSIVYFGYCMIVIQYIEKAGLTMYFYFLINAILLTLTYPLMFLVEKIFGFVSNVTLMELSNLNNSLLLNLSQLAPGTFNHSMQVGNLAAEAARSIGANSLEVRVGALYHDIGKMKDPIFFTENQSGGINPHNTKTLEASTLIIKKHVTDGLELGKHLPRTLRDYIATHHGTSKTGYFYITYKNEHPDEEIDERFFSYPGPKPFTREQAILMLADGVEAAARSIKEYTDKNIDEKVENIVNGKINDGELSDSPLTLREISIIKDVFKKRLKNIHHTRISYPTEKQKETNSTQQEEAK